MFSLPAIYLMKLRATFHEFKQLFGFSVNTTSHNEKLISALGGALGIAGIMWAMHVLVQTQVLTANSSVLIIASMGATAVLLFAVPHGALSQPWAVIGGHFISAILGITCVKLLGNGPWVAALAVGGAIGAMYYLRCVHPPGGATALTIVIGGADINALGYQFLLIPLAINILVIMTITVVFNWCFGWRRYPVHLAHKLKKPMSPQSSEREHELTQEDFAAAMQELDSYVDITPDGLTDLLELAKKHAEKNITHPAKIVAGHIYSNGKLGKLWSIRQVVDAAPVNTPKSKDKVIYKVLAGDGGYETHMCLRSEFHNWARFEVEKHNQQWVKVEEYDKV
ncbi:HPP family protein [Paraglaciecola sp. 20A4]|uniref:HPP family protein n=1 Tax=Paraglaciecola sp. 20A4 TaxID=2687288 RepID=UPI001F0F8AB2|nr:HPP family protein [Paraglaciecola sp. 20A4]